MLFRSAEQVSAVAASEAARANRRIDDLDLKSNQALEGVAVALALSDPVLQPGDSFGIKVGAGAYGANTAVGLSAMGVASRNLFGGGETLAFGGGISVGTNHGNVGGRVGAQLTWK